MTRRQTVGPTGPPFDSTIDFVPFGEEEELSDSTDRGETERFEPSEVSTDYCARREGATVRERPIDVEDRAEASNDDWSWLKELEET